MPSLLRTHIRKYLKRNGSKSKLEEQIQEKSSLKTNKFIYLLMAGHGATDINQGAFPALLPFLVRQHSLSFSAAGGLALALTGVSSIIQPLWGYFADKIRNPQTINLGIILACLGFLALRIATSYPVMLTCVLICGIGVAIFHPEGARMVNCIAKANKGTAMGIFIFGGTFGFSAGSVLIALAVPAFGLNGLFFLIIPGAIVVTLFIYNKRQLQTFSDVEYTTRTDKTAVKLKNNWKGFSILIFVLSLNSIVNYGLIIFIPLFWVNVVGQSEAVAGIAVGVLSALGAISTYLGGKFSDKVGFRNMIIIGSMLYAPAVVFASMSISTLLAAIAIIPLGFTINLSRSSAVSLGQKYLPNNVGLSSGVTLGLIISFGGIAAPFLGLIGDNHGLVAAMMTLAAISCAVALLSFLIPKEK